MTANKLAKEALTEVVHLKKFINRALPGEDFTVKVGGHEIYGSV